jgi:8-oxo-dGTP pyrophosphatase MutT (NUDIX family)
MSAAHGANKAEPPKGPAVHQVSAGGVAFRRGRSGVRVALVSVGPKRRWQLPKGHIDPGETPEQTALREVREEAGIATRIVAPIDTIEYWFAGTEKERRVRFHKRVHFFLLAYRRGDVRRHDDEVIEARWVPIRDAEEMLAFKGERSVLVKARKMIGEGRRERGRPAKS